jgi:drug/metabolite transporter (DMT)-like permease
MSSEHGAFTIADWALLATAALIWGSSFLFIGVAVDHLTPILVAFLRLALGVTVLGIIPAARRKVPWSDWPAIALVGVTWMAAPFLLFSIALQQIDSSLAGMLNAAVPLFTAAIAAVFWRRRPGKRQQLGLLIGLAGVILVTLPSLTGARATPLGVGLVLLATLSYGIALNLAAPLQQRHGALPVIWRAEIVAVLLLAPGGFTGLAGSSFTWSGAAAVTALGVLGTGVAFAAFTTLVGRVGATRASVTAYFFPPVAIVLGALVRSEVIAATSLLGTALVVVGAFLASRANRPRPGSMGIAKAAGLAAVCIAGARAQAQQPGSTAPPVVDRKIAWPLPRLQGPIRLDGRSDDPAWQAVPPLPLTVYLPKYRAEPTERTVARIAYDDVALYVVVDAWEAHPGGVRASSMIRDDDAPGDFVNVLLDSFGDGQNAVTFSTTPGGNRNDWTVSNDAQSNTSLSPAWNGVWDLATRRDPDGWHAEFRIPFSTLRFSSSDGRVEFGLSVNRLSAHSNERVTFPDIEPSAPNALWKPSRTRRVSVEGIHPGRSVRITPYTLAGLEGARAPNPTTSPWVRDGRIDAGGDLKMAVTPNLTLDLTANTDFAEVEVDDQRVNLTRFPLFFPERRPFFLERAGTFELRTAETDLLFNSRRVGLTATGEPVRLLGGARLVGRMGRWDLGAFDAQTGRTPSGARENLGVVRVRRGVLNPRSWVGVMLTSRITSDSSQAAFGADGELNLGGDDYVGFGVATLTGALGSGPDRGILPRSSLRILAERRRNRGLWYRAGISTIGARYAPALGYVERTDAVRPTAEIGYGRVISQAGHILRASLVTALAYRNAAEAFEGATTAGVITLELPSGGVWSLTASRQDDDLLLPFTPTPETSVPAGRFTAGFAQLALTPPNGPRAVIGGSLRAGEYYDGSLYSLALAPEWRASAHLRLAAELQLDRLEFASRGEREWSRLARLRVLASATPQLSMSAVIQANGLARLVTANVRLRYNLSEGHDLWVVYGHHLNLDRDRTTPPAPATASAALLVKYSRSFGR